jgi:hypothetical protein
MPKTFKLLLIIGLAGAVNAPFVFAETPVSVEFGYLKTNHDKYSSGFVWGASIRGDRRLTLGVSVRWYDNTINWETDIEVGGEFVTFWYEETFSIFSVSPYLYYNLLKENSANALFIGAGPQVHFVTAEKVFIRERYSQSVRESRLGFGALLHYERRMSMFGEIRFIAEAYYSYMEGTFEKIDNYQPPLEPVNMTGILVGLGYPL